MSNKSNERIRSLVTEYVKSHPAETSKIAEYIKARIGIKPSRTTIGVILREQGYTPIEQPRFTWLKKAKQ